MSSSVAVTGEKGPLAKGPPGQGLEERVGVRQEEGCHPAEGRSKGSRTALDRACVQRDEVMAPRLPQPLPGLQEPPHGLPD